MWKCRTGNPYSDEDLLGLAQGEEAMLSCFDARGLGDMHRAHEVPRDSTLYSDDESLPTTHRIPRIIIASFQAKQSVEE